MQGGPIMSAIAAKAVALHECQQASYQTYAKNVIANAKALAAGLVDEGMRAISGGTETHLALIDVTGAGVTGKVADERCGASGITLNKNSIPFDPNPPAVSSGIRVGSPSVTTQGMGVPEMKIIANLITRAIKSEDAAEHAKIKSEVQALVGKFPIYA
jgi:glycine hydroxymethyltransferase